MTNQLELTVPHVTNIRLTFPGRTFRLQCDVRDASDVDLNLLYRISLLESAEVTIRGVQGALPLTAPVPPNREPTDGQTTFVALDASPPIYHVMRNGEVACGFELDADVATVELAVAEVREGGLKPRVCELCQTSWNEALEDTGGR